METKSHDALASSSEEMSHKGACTDQGVNMNAEPCNLEPTDPQVAVIVPKEEVTELMNAEPMCKESAMDDPEVAVVQEVLEEVTELLKNAEVPCKESMDHPQVAVVPKLEEVTGEDVTELLKNAEPCKEMDPEVAVVHDVSELMKNAEVPCKELSLGHPEVAVIVPKEEVVTELKNADKEMVPTELVITTNDGYLTIEDCTKEELQQHPLPAKTGSGRGHGHGDGVQPELISTMDEIRESSSVCAINSRGAAAAEEITPPASQEIPLAPEPSAWDNVPDEPVIGEAIQVTPCFPKRPARPAPENEEVDDVVQTMRNILMDLRNEENARLSPEDEEKVRSLLEYHPKAEEKTGCGIDYIKIKRHDTFKDVRCFWVVRTDGSETDFSYHKCLKEKVAKEHPSFVDRYDEIYRAPKRPRRAN